MDLHEDADKNLVTATFELPGLSKDKVNIDLHNGNLIVSGEVSESTEKDEHGYSVRERRTGRFTRSVRLPEGTKVGSVVFPLFRRELWTYGYCSASGRQCRDGKRNLDRYVPQELRRPRASTYCHQLNLGLEKALV